MAVLKIWNGSSWVEIPVGIIDHGGLTGLGDDDHSQYLLEDGSRALSGDLSVGSNKITNLGAPTEGSDAVRLIDTTSGVLFYGLTVKTHNDVQLFKGISTLTFHRDEFYVIQNAPNTDEVMVRPTFINVKSDLSPELGGDLKVGRFRIISTMANQDIVIDPAAGNVDLSGAAAVDLPATTNMPNVGTFKITPFIINIMNFDVGATLAGTVNFSNADGIGRVSFAGSSTTAILDGLNADFSVRAFSADLLLSSRVSGSDVKLIPGAGAGKVVIDGLNWPTSDGANGEVLATDGSSNLSFIDHGGLKGLGDDDHTIYLLADGTRALSGDLSAGSNKITNLGVPTNSTDAARLSDIPPGFYGIIIKETESGGGIYRNDTIKFDSDYFYTSASSSDQKPIISLHHAPGRIAHSTATEGPNNSDAWVTLWEFTLPANSLGTKNIVRAHLAGDMLQLSGGNRTFNVRMTYGSTTITPFDRTIINAINLINWDLIGTLAADGATGSQKMHFMCRAIYQNLNTNIIESLSGYSTVSEDSTTDLVVKIEGKWNIANALTRAEKQIAYAELITD